MARRSSPGASGQDGAAVGRRHRPAGRPTHGAFGHRWCRVAFSPDGKTILTGSYDKTARLWDAATGPARSAGPWTHSDAVCSVAFSPDGKTILTGSGDRTARLWDAATGRPLGQPMEHSGPVISVAFSPDGKTILTGSHDKTARLWDAATGRPLGPAPGAFGRGVRPWRSAPTARRSSPGAVTRRRGCGTPPPASRSARPCRIRLRPQASRR